MVGACGWAFANAIRELWYNLTITGVSVLVALPIGSIEALGLIGDKLMLKGDFWALVRSFKDSLAAFGYLVIGIFILCWIVWAFIYRWNRYDELVPFERTQEIGTKQKVANLG
jgi:high-affinity nickel-transport protein